MPFIRTMLGSLLKLGIGFYFGLYVAQSHPDKVPVVENPQEIAIRLREWIDEATKPKPK